MADENKLPIKVDVSLKAELKGEIPTEKVGNAVDAVLDALSPFTQGMGLIGDHLRFHREKVIIKIGEMAKDKAKKEGLKLNPVPPKFMVPFIEKASCEDLEGELVELWANLLKGAATNYESGLLNFIQILSSIGEEEAKLLKKIIIEKYLDGFKKPPTKEEMALPFVYNEANLDTLFWMIRGLIPEKIPETEKIAAEIEEKINNIFINSKSFLILFLSVPFKVQKEGKKDELNLEVKVRSSDLGKDPTFGMISNLQFLGLVEIVSKEFFPSKEDYLPITVSLVKPTPLGVKFVKTCENN